MWVLQGRVREGDEDVKNAAEIAMDCADMEGGKGYVGVTRLSLLSLWFLLRPNGNSL